MSSPCYGISAGSKWMLQDDQTKVLLLRFQRYLEEVLAQEPLILILISHRSRYRIALLVDSSLRRLNTLAIYADPLRNGHRNQRRLAELLHNLHRLRLLTMNPVYIPPRLTKRHNLYPKPK